MQRKDELLFEHFCQGAERGHQDSYHKLSTRF